jgi:uncharacterized protein YjbJ (UPF0337 family)
MVDKERVKGTAGRIKGAAKEKAGKLSGNEKLQARGEAEKHQGKTRAKVGSKDNLHDVFKSYKG